MFIPIDTWHVVISGFLQTEGRISGCLELWRALSVAYNNDKTTVELRSWDSNWKDLAEVIWRFRPPDKDPLVYIHAYSWGAGYGFVKLAKHLGLRGIAVEHAVLSDPVYRSRFLVVRWRAMAGPTPLVFVPRNVREVTSWHQRTTRPYGSLLVAEDRTATKVNESILVDRSHLFMDDLAAWHNKSIAVARKAEVVAQVAEKN